MFNKLIKNNSKNYKNKKNRNQNNYNKYKNNNLSQFLGCLVFIKKKNMK